MLARAQGIARLAEVRIVERGDRDHLHRRVPQDGIEVARHAAARMLLRQAVGARGVEVMQPQHAGARVGGEGASMLFADAQTNDGDADHALPIDAAKAGTDCDAIKASTARRSSTESTASERRASWGSRDTTLWIRYLAGFW